jgi:hypothetical protein
MFHLAELELFLTSGLTFIKSRYWEAVFRVVSNQQAFAAMNARRSASNGVSFQRRRREQAH